MLTCYIPQHPYEDALYLYQLGVWNINLFFGFYYSFIEV